MAGRGALPGPRRDLRNEIVDLEAERDEARVLARIMYNVLIQFPTSIVEYHDKLDTEKLPDWLTNYNA